MKKLFFAALMLLTAGVASAQQDQQVPTDPKVRIGHLENGMTYYIRHNEEPKGQANFYIAQKVGSILEEDNQRGLAHFLEHMCFNGTENFPGNNIIKYCESIGVKFGADLNAYTSIDETVYNIDNVPVANVPSAIDSCLLILHDWASALLLEDDDIDHERGVIHEEWRSRMDAQMRLYEKILPEAYPGNKYGQRMPIGTMEVVDNFPYQALRDYYAKWYRPDQQGIVVVGDIDVDQVEQKIQKVFGSIPAPVNPAERYYVPIEKNDAPIICIGQDKEMPYEMTYLFLKHDAFPDEMKSGLSYMIYQYALSVANIMQSQRMQEITMTPEPPFVQSRIADDDYFLSKTEGAYTGLIVTQGDLLKGLTATYREMLRALRHGYTASEYDRARTEYLSQLETAYNQREKVKSAEFCAEYVRHFIDNEPIPGIETEFQLMNQVAAQLPVELINQMLAQLADGSGTVVVCMLPESSDAPSKEAIAAALAAVDAEDIEPYEDTVSDEPLISELPVPGKVVKSKDSKFGYRKLTLSNGATVYLKSTDFNKDQILMSAHSFGGQSLYTKAEATNLKGLSEFLSVGGVGNFSVTDLSKMLAGRQVSVSPSVNMNSETVSGSSTPRDFETMLQLTYLYFTALRADQNAYASTAGRLKAILQNAEAQPMTALQDSLNSTIYANKEYFTSLRSSEVDEIDYERVLEIAAERFADASDFRFYFTGAIDEETMIPLIEQYIGALPSTGKGHEKFRKGVTDFVKGHVDNVFEREMEVPMTTVFMLGSGSSKSDLKTSLAFDIALQCLTIDLMEEIREKEGGTYSINASGTVRSLPNSEGIYQIVYQTDPEKVGYLNGRVMEIIDSFIANGPSEDGMKKAKGYMLKTFQEAQRENSAHTEWIETWVENKRDTFTNYEKIVNSITANDVVKAFKTVKTQNNNALVIMKGVAAGK